LEEKAGQRKIESKEHQEVSLPPSFQTTTFHFPAILTCLKLSGAQNSDPFTNKQISQVTNVGTKTNLVVSQEFETKGIRRKYSSTTI
jgi:hypothetical protein